MSAVWEQEDLDAPNGVTFVHNEYGLTIHLETEDGEACHTVPQDRLPDLHRYLSGLVLPKVEREEHGASLSFYRAAGLRDNCFRPNGIVVSCTCKRVTVAEKVLTPEGARALANCLLVAADEADKVDGTPNG